jgi:hypothetical protein
VVRSLALAAWLLAGLRLGTGDPLDRRELPKWLEFERSGAASRAAFARVLVSGGGHSSQNRESVNRNLLSRFAVPAGANATWGHLTRFGRCPCGEPAEGVVDLGTARRAVALFPRLAALSQGESRRCE